MAMSAVQVPRPKNWQDFERASRILFASILNDPATQTNGRSGQRQHGVDVFGMRNGLVDQTVGIQCKGKDEGFGSQVSEDELREEVRKTAGFKPALAEFIVATTAPDDGKIQQSARELTAELAASGRNLRVVVMGWGSLEQEICRFPPAMQAFYPDLTPYTDAIIANLDRGLELQTKSVGGIEEIQAQLRVVIAHQLNAPTPDSKQSDVLDKYLHAEIDTYRDELRAGRVDGALKSLEGMRDRCVNNASLRVRFRIQTNIGAALLRLGRKEDAANLFLEAFALDPDDLIARSNRALAYYLKGDGDAARALAIAEMQRSPKSTSAAVVRLQCANTSEDLGALFAAFSPEVRHDSTVKATYVQSLRTRDDPKWREYAATFASDDVGTDIQRLAAESVVDLALNEFGEKRSNLPSSEDVVRAAGVLSSQWEANKKQRAQIDCALASNAALAFAVIDRVDLAIGILEEAKSNYGFDEPLVRLLALLKAESGLIDEAAELVRTIPSGLRRDALLADLLVKSHPAEALELASNAYPLATLRIERISLGLIEVRAAIAAKKHDAAKLAADRLNRDFPSHPAGQIALYRVADAFGREGAKAHLNAAIGRVGEETDFAGRIYLAKALESARMYDEARKLLENRVETSRDSDGLRLLFATLLSTDRRASAEGLLSELPSELASQPFFLRCDLALAQRSGDLRRAKLASERLLEKTPDDIEVLGTLALLNLRDGDLISVKENLAAAEGIVGNPVESMRIAMLLDHIGEAFRGYALAYRTLLHNSEMPGVALKYVGVFLRPGHSEALPVESNEVAADTAIVLEGPAKETRRFVLEPDSSLRTSDEYIDVAADLAQRLLGSTVGATVDLGGETWAVRAIKHKYLDALHRVLETFHIRFPSAGGLQRVLISGEGKEGLQPILESVKDRHDQIKEVFAIYDAQLVPLAHVAACLGASTVEAFIELSRDGRSIKSCLGNAIERDNAFSSIQQNGQLGCVVDAVAFHIVRRLDLTEAVRSVCGPIAVTASSVAALERRVAEIEDGLGKEDFSISYRNGEYVRSTYSVAEKNSALAILKSDLKWITENDAFIPAIERIDLPDEIRAMDRVLGSGFADDMRAAQATNRLLVSEDLAYRTLASQSVGLRCAWLQPILMTARSQQLISDDTYLKAMISLIDAGLVYVSIEPATLAYAFNEDIRQNSGSRFLATAKRLGGAHADNASHLSVAAEFLRQVWQSNASQLRKSSATGTVLDCLKGSGVLSTARSIDIILVSVGLRGAELKEFRTVVSAWKYGNKLSAS